MSGNENTRSAEVKGRCVAAHDKERGRRESGL